MNETICPCDFQHVRSRITSCSYEHLLMNSCYPQLFADRLCSLFVVCWH